MQAQPVGVAIEQPVRNLGEQAGAIAGVVGGGGAAMRHPGDGRERHRDDLVGADARGVGDEADAAGVVLTRGVERLGGGGRGVSGVGRTGTGRVDPLPKGGHGASCGVAPLAAGEADAGQEKARSFMGAGRGSCAQIARLPGRSRGAGEIEKDDGRGNLERVHGRIIMHARECVKRCRPLTCPGSALACVNSRPASGPATISRIHRRPDAAQPRARRRP